MADTPKYRRFTSEASGGTCTSGFGLGFDLGLGLGHLRPLGAAAIDRASAPDFIHGGRAGMAGRVRELTLGAHEELVRDVDASADVLAPQV